MAQRDKARVTPVLFQQGGIENVQHAGHQPRVFLLLLNEKVNGRLVNVIARAGGPRPQMPAFTALANLEALQRTYERFSQGGIDPNASFPLNNQALITVMREVG